MTCALRAWLIALCKSYRRWSSIKLRLEYLHAVAQIMHGTWTSLNIWAATNDAKPKLAERTGGE